MTIKEHLKKLNGVFEKLHDDFIKLDLDKKNLDEKYTSLVINIKNKYKNERDRLLQQQEDVLKYYRIARDNSNKELVHIGIRPQRPDIGRLNSMIENVNSYSRNDSVAGQIIDLCNAYNAFLKIEIEKIDIEESTELQSIDKNKKNEENDIVYKKYKILHDCEKYLRGEDLKNLSSLFEIINTEYEITSSYFDKWDIPTKRKRIMLLGFSQYHIDVPQKLCSIIKNNLGHYFDERTKMVNYPCEFVTGTLEEILIEYTDTNAVQVKLGIQALILNFLRLFNLTGYKVSVWDYIHYNADVLGALRVFVSVKDGIIGNIPSNDKEINQSISLLANYYRKVESKIGFQSVYEYNKTHKPEERIPCRIIIINRTQEAFNLSGESEMAYIINNAVKLGILIIRMEKSRDGGSRGKEREKMYLIKAPGYVRIISDDQGTFYIENDKEWQPFKWLTAPSMLPPDFVSRVQDSVKPVELGTKYFNRYKPKLPERSNGKRKPVSIPFAINEEDKVIECSFENELFAAYMMGASRSGKSTLLHTMISSLIMNYHPDELELWLMDFKMLEFKKYANYRLPHIKYLLLEKSEDLVYDIIDRLEEVLAEREYIFSQNGWQKLADVPVDFYMPVIFVIIDEFAQMSQILKETRGTGYGTDYTLKLANLLQKGAAMGFKFIFASQTYSDGVEGLNEPARKQIQQRFALKNTYQEIKDTLSLPSDAITPNLQHDINTLPPYESLFKWRTDSGELRVDRLRNMYTEGDEVDRLVEYIAKNMHVTNDKLSIDDRLYIDKNPIFIDGGEPKTFKSQIPYYKKYETADVLEELDDDDILIYPGVPCSFKLARPFTLANATAENILIVGGDRENELSIALSVFNSYSRKKYPIKIWANERSSIYRRYKSTVLCKYKMITDLEDICSNINEIKKNVLSRQYNNCLIMVLGYEAIVNDLELFGDDIEPYEESVVSNIEIPEDMSQVMEKIKACDNVEEKKRILADYNARVEEYESKKASTKSVKTRKSAIYDARDDMEWIIKRASAYGIHFIFCFEKAKDFLDIKLDDRAFRHKIAFAMSREDSSEIIGNRRANEIEAGVCLYSNGKDIFSMHPHLYYGVPCNGWQINEEGNVVQRRS